MGAEIVETNSEAAVMADLRTRILAQNQKRNPALHWTVMKMKKTGLRVIITAEIQ
jgi:hypothetical protein